MNFFKDIKNTFGKPNVLRMKAEELLEAEINLLKAQSGMEYAKSMVLYHTTRIERLKLDISKSTG
jgi:hypothetical protein